MKTLKQILSAALVLAMLLSCVGAAPGEAEAQDGTPVQSEPFIENAPAPVEDTAAPAEDTAAPAEDAPAPVEDTPAPAVDITAPAEDTTAPVEDTAAPVEDTTAPAEEAPVLEADVASASEPVPAAAAGSIVLSSSGWTYGDSVTNPTTKFDITNPDGYSNPTLTFGTMQGTYDAAVPTNAGNYWVQATWTKTDDPNDTVTAEAPFTISRKTVRFTLNLTKTYTGAEIVLTKDDLPNAPYQLIPNDWDAVIAVHTAVTNAQAAAPLDEAKAKAVIMRGEEDISADYTVVFSGNLTVRKADLGGATVTVTFTNPVYNGTAQIPTKAVVMLGEVVIDPNEYEIVAGARTVTNVADGDGMARVRAKADAANVQGDKTAAYGIDAFDIANATVELTDGGREYTGEPLAAPAVAVTANGKVISAEDYDVAFPDDLTNAGEKTVTITAKKGGNYKGTKSEMYTVAPKSLAGATVELEPKKFVYNGTRQEAAVTAVKDGNATLTAGKDYKVDYTSNDGDALTAAGVVTVIVTGQGNYDGDIKMTYVIEKKPVTLTAVGTKLFGAEDPDCVVLAESSKDTAAGNRIRVTVTGLVNADDANLFGIKAKHVPGATGELPGTYDIELAVDAAKATNYAVTGDDGDGVFSLTIEDAFTIDTKAAFTVSLGGSKKITTHTLGAVGYTISPANGQKLISKLQDFVDVTLIVDDKEASAALSDHSIQAKNVPDTIPGAGGTFSIPKVDYASGTMTWQSGLPAGTKLTVTVASNNDTGASVTSAKAVTVADVDVNMKISWTPGVKRSAYEDGDPYGNGRLLLDENGTITIAPEKGDEEFVGDDDWIELTVGGNKYYYSTKNADDLNVDAKPGAHGALTLDLDQLKALVGATGEEGGWFGLNPKDDYLTIQAVLVDNMGHFSESHHIHVAFDTSGYDSTQSADNRITVDSLALSIQDSVNVNRHPVVTVSGTYGSYTIDEDISAVGGVKSGALTWNSANYWMRSPLNLPAAGSSIKVQYQDVVGHEVEHVINVGPSEAVTLNTIFVKPMTDDTVPSGKLQFYGETNAWERSTLTVGGQTYEIGPLSGGGETYDNSVKQWTQTVDLAEINFPVGVPTEVKLAYNDLRGGDATIEITYKNEAQTPVMGSEAVAGSNVLWGYVESSASAVLNIRHADDSVTAVPADNVEVDQFGYWFARLNAPLASGDVIEFTTMDFCGNVKRVEYPVQDALPDGSKAEVLGANIIGETDANIMEHRFATPIDLSDLEPGGDGFELPILAYKGIEIGRMTGVLTEDGKLELGYDIKAVDYVPEGGQAYLSTYASKPTIDELTGAHDVAVEDVKSAPTGTLATLDVSAHADEDGNFSGVLWLCAQFDVDMDETNYNNRGGRGVNFYRWLTESLQTENLLNTVYSEMSSYTDNVAFYKQYQQFENISKTI